MSSSPQPSALDGRQFLDELEASLRNQPNLDAVDRDFLIKHFREALDNPQANAQGFDRQSWVDAVAQLGLGEAEQEALLNRFDQAFQPLQGETRELGDEFTRRLARDGEASAQQWLQGEIDRIKRARGAGTAAQIAQGLPPQVGKVAMARKPGPWG